jgi:hypothetical protein
LTAECPICAAQTFEGANLRGGKPSREAKEGQERCPMGVTPGLAERAPRRVWRSTLLRPPCPTRDPLRGPHPHGEQSVGCDLASLHSTALDNPCFAPCFAIDAAPGQGYTARPPDGPPARATGCPGGGIGRRAGFRYLWPQGRGSSSLLLGTRISCQRSAFSCQRRRVGFEQHAVHAGRDHPSASA